MARAPDKGLPMSVRSTAKPISPLRWRAIDDMTIRNFSPAARRSYLHTSKFIAGIFASQRTGSASNTREGHRLDGDAEPDRLHFAHFYGVTLAKDEVPERVPSARKPAALPDVLDPGEVMRFTNYAL